jgi:hypothetical protein
MKLYILPTSPNSRKVLAVIHYLGLKPEIVCLDFASADTAKPEFLALNPKWHGASPGRRDLRPLGVQRHQPVPSREGGRLLAVSARPAEPRRYHALAILGAGAFQQGLRHADLRKRGQTEIRTGRGERRVGRVLPARDRPFRQGARGASPGTLRAAHPARGHHGNSVVGPEGLAKVTRHLITKVHLDVEGRPLQLSEGVVVVP